MIESFISSLIQDILMLLRPQKDFFGLDKVKRAQIAEDYSGSKVLADYLSHVSEAAFVDDLHTALKEKKGPLVQLLADYFLREFPLVFDQLNSQFYRLSGPERKKFAESLFPKNTAFTSTAQEYLLLMSYQEISENIVVFLKECYDSPRIMVQSPLETDSKTKTEIRQYFSKTFPRSFVTFSINSQLIGGIRFFVDGKVDDLSWFSKIQAIRSLVHH